MKQTPKLRAAVHIGPPFFCPTTRRTQFNSSLKGIHLTQLGPTDSVSVAWKITLRFNRRTSRHKGKLFYRLLQQAVSVEPVPFSKLVVPGGHHE